MTKAIGLIALSLSLEAAFLFQVTVIARPEPRAAVMAVSHAPATATEPASVAAVTGADANAPVAQSTSLAVPRS